MRAILTPLYPTSKHCGCGEAEFDIAAEGLGNGEALVDFAQRDPEDRSIEAMGYVEVDDEFGFHYERIW